MTQLLETYLKIAFAGPAESKQIIEREIPRNLASYHEGKLIRTRELLLSESVEGTTLIQTQMYATVMEGAQPQRCFREALPIFNTTSDTLRVPLGAAGAYASEVAEGAEIPSEEQDYSYRDFVVKKYGVRPLITNEMIEDCKYDMISQEVMYAGAKMENTLNQLHLTALLDNAGLEHDTAGTNQGVKAMGSAQTLMRNAHYNPSVTIMHPQAEGSVLSGFTLTNYAGSQSVLNSGQVPTILGMDARVCGVSDDSDTYTWGYDTDGYIGMLVLDAMKAGATAMRRDISLERYSDPIRDLLGVAVTARWGVNYLQANAIARVEY
jgi:HK97 family phage major capsid protein